MVHDDIVRPAILTDKVMIRPQFSAMTYPADLKPWDTVILETDDFVLTPTLGSVVPNWLLLWPKQPYLSCLDWKGADTNLDEVARYALSKLNAPLPENYIWFEHGCSKYGSLTGCGVNYAHLHILIDPDFSLDEFQLMVKRLLRYKTAEKAVPTSRNRSLSEDYHSYGGNGKSYTPHGSGKLGSQFFRKVVASLANEVEKWDYREHPFEVNVLKTLEALAPL